MGPIRKYLWLINKLRNYGRLPFKSLAQMWQDERVTDKELTNRTFHEYRKAIAELFDIEIVNENCGDYRYYIEGLENLKNDEFRSWLLNSYSVMDQLQVDKKLQNRVFFENVPSGQQWLTYFTEAMRNNKVTTITYKRLFNGTDSTYNIEPYALKLFNRRWYVIARSPYWSERNQRDEIRIYGLDRITNVKITDLNFIEPEPGSIESMFENCYGIIADQEVKVERVVIRAWGPQYDYLRSLPLHSTQTEIAEDEESVTFEYFVRPTFDFYQALLAQTDYVEVLEPDTVRNEIRNFTKNMYYHYKDDEQQ